jgi:LysM repeat protein
MTAKTDKAQGSGTNAQRPPEPDPNRPATVPLEKTVSHLSVRYSVPISDLLKWNNLTEGTARKLRAGTPINLYPPAPKATLSAEQMWAKPAGSNSVSDTAGYKQLSAENQQKVKLFAEQQPDVASPGAQQALARKLLNQQQTEESLTTLTGSPVDSSKVSEETTKLLASPAFSALRPEQKKEVAKAYVSKGYDSDAANAVVEKYAHENSPNVAAAMSALKNADVADIDTSRIKEGSAKLFAGQDFLSLPQDQKNQVAKQFASDLNKSVTGLDVMTFETLGAEQLLNQFKFQNSPEVAAVKTALTEAGLEANFDAAKTDKDAAEVFNGEDFKALQSAQKQIVAKAYVDGKNDSGAATDAIERLTRENTPEISAVITALKNAGVTCSNSSRIRKDATTLFQGEDFKSLNQEQQNAVATQYANSVNTIVPAFFGTFNKDQFGGAVIPAQKLLKKFKLENTPEVVDVKASLAEAGVQENIDAKQITTEARDFFRSEDYKSLVDVKQKEQTARAYLKGYDVDDAKELLGKFKRENSPAFTSVKEQLTKAGVNLALDATKVNEAASNLFSGETFGKLTEKQKATVGYEYVREGYDTERAQELVTAYEHANLPIIRGAKEVLAQHGAVDLDGREGQISEQAAMIFTNEDFGKLPLNERREIRAVYLDGNFDTAAAKTLFDKYIRIGKSFRES